MADGQSATIALKKQSAINTPATGTYNVTLFDRYNDTTGRMVTTGAQRIGGGLSQTYGGIVLGASPAFQGSGPLDLNTIGTWLEAAGRGVTGAGPFVYTPVTASSAYSYFTADVNRIPASLHYRIRDCRLLRLGMSFMSGEEPRFECMALGGNVDDSSATTSVPSSMKQPSPAETIAGANSMIFGSSAFTVLDFQYFIEVTLDNRRRPLGKLTPDDIRVTNIRPRVVVRIDCTSANWRRLFLGSDSATSISTAIVGGALNMRLNVAGATSYIEFAWASAEYVAEQPGDIRAEEEQYVILGGRPTGAVTETVSLS